MFSCATDMAHAGLTASWLKDNKPIGDNMADRAKITAKENVFTLTIDKVASGDSGQYTCRVTNANNETCTCSAQLEVHQRTDLDPIFSHTFSKTRERDANLKTRMLVLTYVHRQPGALYEPAFFCCHLAEL